MGSGKSAVANYLRSKQYVVIDADQIAHEVLAPQSPGALRVVQTFGQDMLKQDGSLDRKKMAELVFSNPEKLSQLENIVHPLIRQKVQEVRRHFAGQGHRILFYDVPLLYEKRMQDQFDKVVLVVADDALRMQRLQKRDGHSSEHIQKRIAAQLPLAEKRKWADFVIDNNGDLKSLESQIEDVLQQLPTPGTPKS